MTLLSIHTTTPTCTVGTTWYSPTGRCTDRLHQLAQKSLPTFDRFMIQERFMSWSQSGQQR